MYTHIYIYIYREREREVAFRLVKDSPRRSGTRRFFGAWRHLPLTGKLCRANVADHTLIQYSIL